MEKGLVTKKSLTMHSSIVIKVIRFKGMWLRFNENHSHHLHFLFYKGLHNCMLTELDFQTNYFSEFNFEIPRDSLR